MISRPELSPDERMMLPDVSDTLARLSTGQIGQIEPSLCKLEQMRLIGGGAGSASKFQRRYCVSSVFVFFSDHGPPVSPRAPQLPHASKTRLMGDRSGNSEKRWSPGGNWAARPTERATSTPSHGLNDDVADSLARPRRRSARRGTGAPDRRYARPRAGQRPLSPEKADEKCSA